MNSEMLPREIIELARQQLDGKPFGFEALFTMRKFMGFRDEISEVFGAELLNSIDGLTSECDFDFVPARQDIQRISSDKKAKIEKELIAYFSLNENVVRKIFESISSIK